MGDNGAMPIDDQLAAAVDSARTALVEAVEAGFGGSADAASIGEHLGAESDAELLVSHRFACLTPGYRGWYWSVSISRAPDTDQVTVNDVVLLPGDDAIVAPPWTPYRDRIRPGDLSPGDVLPPDEDDIRLVPSWSAGDGDEQTDDRFFACEVGLGREWVLSLEGREIAAQRWQEGEQGPDVPIAQQASGVCHSCGFMVSLAGPLSERFGVCANGMANDDGRVVSFDHGCGAHSGARLSRAASSQKLPDPVFDTLTRDEVDGL